jgi:hypothetical protein
MCERYRVLEKSNFSQSQSCYDPNERLSPRTPMPPSRAHQHTIEKSTPPPLKNELVLSYTDDYKTDLAYYKSNYKKLEEELITTNNLQNSQFKHLNNLTVLNTENFTVWLSLNHTNCQKNLPTNIENLKSCVFNERLGLEKAIEDYDLLTGLYGECKQSLAKYKNKICNLKTGVARLKSEIF